MRSRGPAEAGPSVEGSSPSPTSRLRCNAYATATSTPVTTSGNSSTQNRSPANGRAWVDQPMGDDHDNHVTSAESPTARSANATPRTAPASPLAVLEYSASCAVTAATPVKTSATAVSPSPNANAPAVAMPVAASATAVATPVTSANPPHTTSAAVRGAYLPTTVDDSSSCLPVSSSCLVCRTIVNTHTNAANTDSIVPNRQAVKPPAVDRSWAGPYNSEIEGLSPRLVVSEARCAGSG